MPRDCCRDVSLEKHFQSFRGLFFFCDQQIWETEVEREREKEREDSDTATQLHYHVQDSSFFLSLTHSPLLLISIHSLSLSLHLSQFCCHWLLNWFSIRKISPPKTQLRYRNLSGGKEGSGFEFRH
jgi:hypothetical protein